MEIAADWEFSCHQHWGIGKFVLFLIETLKTVPVGCSFNGSQGEGGGKEAHHLFRCAGSRLILWRKMPVCVICFEPQVIDLHPSSDVTSSS